MAVSLQGPEQPWHRWVAGSILVLLRDSLMDSGEVWGSQTRPALLWSVLVLFLRLRRTECCLLGATGLNTSSKLKSACQGRRTSWAAASSLWLTEPDWLFFCWLTVWSPCFFSTSWFILSSSGWPSWLCSASPCADRLVVCLNFSPAGRLADVGESSMARDSDSSSKPIEGVCKELAAQSFSLTTSWHSSLVCFDWPPSDSFWFVLFSHSSLVFFSNLSCSLLPAWPITTPTFSPFSAFPLTFGPDNLRFFRVPLLLLLIGNETESSGVVEAFRAVSPVSDVLFPTSVVGSALTDFPLQRRSGRGSWLGAIQTKKETNILRERPTDEP